MIRRIFLYALLPGLILLPWLAWETDRNMVRRWAYPLKGWVAAASTRCDGEAPAWVERAARTMAVDHSSPANQLAYVTPDGVRLGCVNGWQGLPWLSPRITEQTSFRLASLSKIVTFMGVIQGLGDGDGWLDQPAVQVLEVPPPYTDARVTQIRIRQLVNHSGGFDRMRAEDSMVIRDKKPWCPGEIEKLASIRLQFDPGTQTSYSNIGYCLLAAAYAKKTGKKFEEVLKQEAGISRYGIGYLRERDSPVEFNFMNEGFYDASFTRYFDWQALTSSMGMTGSAAGLADFIQANRKGLQIAQAMHDTATCNESQYLRCMDGFLARQRVDGKLLWSQGGYLYGMSALFLLDEEGRMLIWLGAGTATSRAEARRYIEREFLAGRS